MSKPEISEISKLIDQNRLKLLVRLQLNPTQPSIEIIRSMRNETPTLGTMLRQAREAIPLSIRELHEKSGLSTSTIFYIESNQKIPHQKTVRKMAEALGLDPTTLAPFRHII